jgi:hypothetical protein
MLQKYIINPLYLISSYALIGAVTASVVAPFAYLLFGALYWMNRGRWFEYTVCGDLGLLCPQGKRLGLDQIFVWISDRPFIFLCLCGVVVVAVSLAAMTALNDSIRRSKRRLDTDQSVESE